MDIATVSLDTLYNRYKKERDGRIKQRLHIFLLSKEGKPQREIAQILHISLGKVNFWIQRFAEEGFDGLSDKPGRGRKAKLTTEQLHELEETTGKPIQMSNGYTRGWQTKDLIQHIKKTYGVTYSPRGARDLFKKLGFVRLVPRPRNKSRNQGDVEGFKKSSVKSWKKWEQKIQK